MKEKYVKLSDVIAMLSSDIKNTNDVTLNPKLKKMTSALEVEKRLVIFLQNIPRFY